MNTDPAAVLDFFFRIPEDIIKRDLLRARNNLKLLHDELAGIRAIDRQDRTPEAEAQIHHLMMVQACELCHLSHVAPEFKTFYGASGAGHVTQDAEMAAHDKGKLSELSQQMKKIQEREGLLDDEFWYRGEGPEDYEELEGEYSRISAGISETVFVHTLRRYGMSKLADLYEQDNQEFEIQREIGRRLVFGSKSEDFDMDAHMNQSILKRHGQTVLDRILNRVAELNNGNG